MKKKLNQIVFFRRTEEDEKSMIRCSHICSRCVWVTHKKQIWKWISGEIIMNLPKYV